MSPDLKNLPARILDNPEPLHSASTLEHLFLIVRRTCAPQRSVELDDVGLLAELRLLTPSGPGRETCCWQGGGVKSLDFSPSGGIKEDPLGCDANYINRGARQLAELVWVT